MLTEEDDRLMAYVFDTNSFRELGSYYPDRFPTFWERFNQAVAIGKIVSVREVRRELELQAHHSHIFDWAKDHVAIFSPPEPVEMLFVNKIFSVRHFQELVNRKNVLKGRPCADPFIIARAKVIYGCVVTEETWKENAPKIPNVCEYFEVDCTNLQGFMEREGWTF